jgi:hypothetical protein
MKINPSYLAEVKQQIQSSDDFLIFFLKKGEVTMSSKYELDSLFILTMLLHEQPNIKKLIDMSLKEFDDINLKKTNGIKRI